MRPSKTLLALLLTAACLAACGPRTHYLPQSEIEAGEEYDHSLVGFFSEGDSTQTEVHAYLGEPLVIERHGEQEVWYYYYRKVRDRYGEDWSGQIVSHGRDTIEEHAATLTFVGGVLWRIDTRLEPLMADNAWVREPNPNPESFGSEYGPQSR